MRTELAVSHSVWPIVQSSLHVTAHAPFEHAGVLDGHGVAGDHCAQPSLPTSQVTVPLPAHATSPGEHGALHAVGVRSLGLVAHAATTASVATRRRMTTFNQYVAARNRSMTTSDATCGSMTPDADENNDGTTDH